MIKYALTLLVALLICSGSYAQKEKLELKLTKGDTYNQRMNVDMAMNQTVQGQEMNISFTMEAKMSYQVTDKIDTVYTITCKYESMSMKMNLPTGVVEYGSEGKADDMFTKIMSAMKKNSFTMKMSKYGKVLAVTGIDKLFDGIDGIPAEQLEMMKAQLSQSYGEQAFKGNMEMSMAIYPTKAVQAGDQWTIKGTLKSGMQANIATIYTLKEVTDQYYLVSGISTITPSNVTTDAPNGMKIKSNMQGDMQSNLKINKTTGWITEGEINQNLKGNTEVQPTEQLPEGMSIPMDMKIKMRITDK